MTCGSYGQQLPQTGLYFYAHNQNLDQRTSLELNNSEPYSLKLQDKFTLEFDLFLRDELVKFGYVFRIVSANGENFDLLVKNEPNIFFVINNQDFQLKTIPPVGMWNHIALTFDKPQDRISLRFNDEIIDCPHSLTNVQSLNISFGQSFLKNFLTSDVSPVILKDIQVAGNDKAIHHWKLNKHGNDMVLDELRNKPAKVFNPNWLIDCRIYWKQTATLETSLFPQITFDSIANAIYLLDDSRLITYSLLTDSVETALDARIPPAGELCNSLLFNSINGSLLYYDFQETGILHTYDFEKKKWSPYAGFEEEGDHAHHNRYVSPYNGNLYLFGGYGHYKYNSDFTVIDLKTNKKTTLDFSHTITPRYLAAMGGNKAGDKLYILGGKGAEMGRQELSPKNFSDLYEVDLQTDKVKHLFDLPKSNGDKTNLYSNSLVVTGNDSSLYVLAYSNDTYATAINLNRINIYTQQIEELADSIEFYFRDITSFCDLYYSPRLSKLIAIAAYSNDQKISKVNIYTLDFPPLQVHDVMQDIPKQSKRGLLAYCFVVLLLVSGLLVFIKKKRRFFFSGDPGVPTKKILVITQEKDLTEREKPFYDLKKQAIVFLGGFQVFDKDGKNITGEFTPTLKYILVLIILYTLKNNKGISSTKLQELLWFDKSEEAARNNRSVNIRKLRVLLQGLGNADITNENSYWTITLANDILCDYREALRLLRKMQEEEQNPEEDLLRLLELLNAGVMLPNIQFEWVDAFKTDFSNEVIDTLMRVINNHKNAFHSNLDISLKIADCLLKIDPINEDALGMKIKALSAMGKKGLAKSALDSFTKEYKVLLGETYHGSLNNFLS
jgi:DNA-binding SARP family transcriptional activator